MNLLNEIADALGFTPLMKSRLFSQPRAEAVQQLIALVRQRLEANGHIDNLEEAVKKYGGDREKLVEAAREVGRKRAGVKTGEAEPSHLQLLAELVAAQAEREARPNVALSSDARAWRRVCRLRRDVELQRLEAARKAGRIGEAAAAKARAFIARHGASPSLALSSESLVDDLIALMESATPVKRRLILSDDARKQHMSNPFGRAFLAAADVEAGPVVTDADRAKHQSNPFGQAYLREIGAN